MNTNFLNNTIDNFLQCAYGKKLILFGAGDEMYKALPLFVECNGLKAEYAVDNDFRKWYSRFLGLKIYEPSVLKDEDPDKTVVLITSLYPHRIEEQIVKLGMKYYYSSYLFVEMNLGKRQFLVTF
jgi:hypothetical protein